MSSAVDYATDAAIGVLTLRRPDNRNSMTPELLDAFTAASAQARADTAIRCLVVTGSGSCFSSGADFRSTVQREGATQLVVLLRVEANKIGKVRAFTADCDVDAGGLPVYWLTDVRTGESADGRGLRLRLLFDLTINDGRALLRPHDFRHCQRATAS